MKNSILGKVIRQPQGFNAFVPHKFPPEQGIEFSFQTIKKSTEATRLLGKLDGISYAYNDYLKIFNYS